MDKRGMIVTKADNETKETKSPSNEKLQGKFSLDDGWRKGMSRTISRNDNVLTVFQAAPLVWKDEREGKFMPVEGLDFDKEREMLSDSLMDAEKVGAKVDLRFETATTETLVSWLETNRSEALHFSCHGYSEGLCFEDGAGGTHWVDSNSLSEITATAGGNLRFVFVSACCSRAAGEAFISAGVKHVVCCQKDQELMDEATIKFSASFYRALARGEELQTAFRRGQLAVKSCPLIADPEAEMRKFLLLPEHSDHNVSVFQHSNTLRQTRNEVESFGKASMIIPHPPDHFFGREVDIYKVLQSLSQCRLVRITGEHGIGKGSLAAAVCQYINSRHRCFRMGTVIWLPLLTSPSEDIFMSALHRVFDIIQNESLQVFLREDCEFRRMCGIIFEKLSQTNALLAIDARQFAGELPMEKLSLFLELLLRATKKARIILVCSDEMRRWWKSPCVEVKHELDTLHFKASALLFGAATPFVAARRHREAWTPHRFSNLLVDEEVNFCKVGDAALSKQSLKIFDSIGGGHPARVLEAARTMGPQGFDELISLARKKASPQSSQHV